MRWTTFGASRVPVFETLADIPFKIRAFFRDMTASATLIADLFLKILA